MSSGSGRISVPSSVQIRTPFNLEGQTQLVEGGRGGGWVLVKPKMEEPILALDAASLVSRLAQWVQLLLGQTFPLLQVMSVLG